MLKSEKQSLIRFLLIYLGSTFLLFTFAAGNFYQVQKQQLLEQQRHVLKYESDEIKSALRLLHEKFDAVLVYPVRPSVDSAIYDANKQYIFGTFKHTVLLDEVQYQNDEEKLYVLSPVEPHYLGAAFLLVSQVLDKAPILQLQRSIGYFMLLAGVLFSILGLFLGKLFVAPMRDSMKKMNRFIEDTTHELNTPISTILTNIEMLETFGKCKNHEELQRIEIASKTLSRIYDDLTYLNFNHKYYRKLESVDVSELANERLVYFSAMAQQKGVHFEVHIDTQIVLEIDKNDFTRLLDNLIVNAIKYNKPQGVLTLELTKDFLSVSDTGIGIPKKELKTIHCRFKRANQSEGGFGIGLDIVNQVTTHYGFVLKIDSSLHQGTKVLVSWKK